MKKFNQIAIPILLVIIYSCSKDYTDPQNLTGTSWKSTDLSGVFESNVEYITLKFISTSKVEGWTKAENKSEYKEWTGTYEIDGKAIDIYHNNFLLLYGNIIKTKMHLIMDMQEFVFTKQ